MCEKCQIRKIKFKGLCSRCYSLQQYHKNKNKYKGRNKEYQKVYNEAYQKKNRERLTAYRKEYRKTGGGRVATERARKRYMEKNKDKWKIWGKNQYIKIEKRCIICGSIINIIKHHPNYDAPNIVVPLCAIHHKEVHKLT